MAELDLLIVPGYWYETFGFSTIEAIANNVPVLVSEHTGSKDLLIEMTTPRFFEPNVLELSKLLEKYIQNPELLKKACKEQNNIHLVCTMREHVKLLLHALSI